MKRTVILFAGVFVLACTVSLKAQIRVIKNARGFNGDATVVYRGVNGDAALSNAVASFLRACGWFKLSSGKADYTVSGRVSGGRVNLTVTSTIGPGFNISQSVSGGDRETAKRLVDAILKAVFKIDGICRTKIAFSGESSPGIKNIYLCDIDGGGVKRLTSFRSLCVESSWSPGGRSVVYTKYGRAVTSIIETRLSPLSSRRLVGYPGLNAGAKISPNGKYLALILSKDGQVELYVKALEGRARRRLTNSSTPESTPCWSPSGGQLCFVSGSSGRPQLYIIGANGGRSVRLNTEGSEATSPSWSKKDQIVYSCRMGRSYAIAVYDIKTGNNEILTKTAGSWESPSWAPDDRHIVCCRTYGGKTALYIIDSMTGEARKLIGGGSSLTMPSWSPLL